MLLPRILNRELAQHPQASLLHRSEQDQAGHDNIDGNKQDQNYTDVAAERSKHRLSLPLRDHAVRYHYHISPCQQWRSFSQRLRDH